jgi:hypothetical protein
LHIALKLTVKERSDQVARWVDLAEREANDGATPGRHVRFHDRGHLFYSARGRCDARIYRSLQFWTVPAGDPHPSGSRRSHHRSRHRDVRGN